MARELIKEPCDVMLVTAAQLDERAAELERLSAIHRQRADAYAGAAAEVRRLRQSMVANVTPRTGACKGARPCH